MAYYLCQFGDHQRYANSNSFEGAALACFGVSSGVSVMLLPGAPATLAWEVKNDLSMKLREFHTSGKPSDPANNLHRLP